MKKIILLIFAVVVLFVACTPKQRDVSSSSEPLPQNDSSINEPTISKITSSGEISSSSEMVDELKETYMAIKTKPLSEITSTDIKLILSKSYEELAEIYGFDLEEEYNKGARILQGETCATTYIMISKNISLVWLSIAIGAQPGEETPISGITYGMNIDGVMDIIGKHEVIETFLGRINPSDEYYIEYYCDGLIYKLCFDCEKELYQIRVFVQNEE